MRLVRGWIAVVSRAMRLAYFLSPWTDVNRKQSVHGDSVKTLDGLRGLAVLIVLASHAQAFGMAGQGVLGVFLFFTLSGFVLTMPFVDRPERIFRPRELWFYFANRALRIIPAFVIAVLVVKWQQQESWFWVWRNVSFSTGWNHFWSVAEEVRFYFLFPFVLGLLALLSSRLWRIAALICLILLAWALQHADMIDMMDGRFVLFYFYFFLAGMLACLIYRSFARGVFAIVALAIVAAIFFLPFNGWEYSELWCLLFFVLLVCAAGTDIWPLRLWIARHVGLLSYSLYLFHVPVMTWLQPLQLETLELFNATLVITYVVALASYLLIEKPFLMLKPRAKRPASAPRMDPAVGR
jgi:peptidoglycan/LPS O-acetylase OafA/YrhL